MKIICFGDSNTYGYDPRSFFGDRYGAENRWVDILERMIGCELINSGENGREIPALERELIYFDGFLSACQPVNLLIIMLGTNDLLQGYPVETVAERMECFLRRIDLQPDRILLIAPPTMKLGEWVPSRSLIRASEEMAMVYKALAERLGTGFADAGKWSVGLAFDGVHFTVEGHRVFAKELCRYLIEEKKIEKAVSGCADSAF